ncbi:MAG: NADH-quinone oxidoreductase subunit K [Candidatus Omnitrophica bacterium]|nr:NADH-quinone oxidoreductase subunit K [Candidatus Omnitrophota bacterium]
MNPANMQLLWVFGMFVVVLSVIGIYCVLVTYNLIRALIGLEIIIKAVTLMIVVAGHITGHEALAQSLVITLIVIEAVMITVGVGIVVGITRHTGSLDLRKISNLKG